MKIGGCDRLVIKNEERQQRQIKLADGGELTESYKRYRTQFEFLIDTLQTSGILAVVVVSTICGLILVQSYRGQEIKIPEFLTSITTLIVGFYFGRKTIGVSDGQPANEKKKIGFKPES